MKNNRGLFILVVAVSAIIIGGISFILFLPSVSLGQGAQGTASSEQTTDYALGGTSAAAGSAIMAWSCPWTGPCALGLSCETMCYLVGPSLIVNGAMDIEKGISRSSDITPLAGSNPTVPACDPTSELCYQAPPPGNITSGGTGSTGTTPTITSPYNTLAPNSAGTLTNPIGAPTSSQVPPSVAAALQNALQTAQQYGVNPLDPASVQQAAQNAGVNTSSSGSGGGGGGSGGGSGGGIDISKLPPDVLKEIEKAKKAALASLNIDDLGGGSGGSRSLTASNAKNDADFDINSLLEKLNPKKAAREPGSVEGLQKNFNGEPIGVAADDIFKQISRRYQKKIQARAFINQVK